MSQGSTLILILCAVGLTVTCWRCRVAETRRRWAQGADRPLNVVRINR